LIADDSGDPAVMTDDLSAPLGLNKPAARPQKLSFAQLHVVAGASGLSLVFLTGWMFLAEKPVARSPVAAAHLQAPMLSSNAEPVAEPTLRVIRLSPDDRTDSIGGERPAAATRTITIIDGTSGRRQEIEIPLENNVEAPPEPARVESPRPSPPPRATNGSRSTEPKTRSAKRNPGRTDAPVSVRASGID
jgi:uncharacterized protein